MSEEKRQDDFELDEGNLNDVSGGVEWKPIESYGATPQPKFP